MTIELNNNVYTDGGNDTETTPSRLCRQLRQWGANVKE